MFLKFNTFCIVLIYCAFLHLYKWFTGLGVFVHHRLKNQLAIKCLAVVLFREAMPNSAAWVYLKTKVNFLSTLPLVQEYVNVNQFEWPGLCV